jgi:apolipoprotein N-acyltransferase
VVRLYADRVNRALLAVLAAAISVFAFPPFGPGWLIVLGIALFLTALRKAEGRGQGAVLGAIYGLGFFTGLMWWMSKLGLIALVPMVLVEAAFFVIYSVWLSGQNDDPPVVWWVYAVGGWGIMELIRYRFPVGGLEWGAAGYALSDAAWSRGPAVTIGTTGLTILVVMIAGMIALGVTRRLTLRTGVVTGSLVVLILTLAAWPRPVSVPLPLLARIITVQGSTPCPFEACPPDQRLRTFQQHLELTKSIEATGDIGLVVWSEGSTGSTNADPVQNPEIGAAIGEQARRLGSWFLVGTDRPLDDETWVNANVVFNPDGEIVGEYRKQHGVPFGEYIPLRPLFDWIPALDAVPRDMIPGEGPVIFETGNGPLGSVISFEGGFSRYARQNVLAGAETLVVATNEGSYETTPASDQFIGMTRMRATELGVPVVHAAVTGKSVFIDAEGNLSETTGLGTQEVLESRFEVYRGETPYARVGDVLIWLGAAAALVLWLVRYRLVGSAEVARFEEEENVGGVGEPAP